MAQRTSMFFYAALIAVSSLVVGMVIASRLDLAPASFAGSLSVPETNSAPLDGPLDASTFRNIASEAGPSVVSILTEVPAQRRGSLRDLFPGIPDVFGGEEPEPGPEVGAGSGFIIDESGFVLTNRHVIQNATRIEVFTAEMDATLNIPGLEAEVVGQDALTDTALLRIGNLPAQGLKAVPFGDSEQLAPGDWVMAIGNPFNLSNTVTVGVVSTNGREQALAVPGRSEAMIQTDAAINRGNSGGPLLNIRGEVVGMNTMIVSDGRGANLGIGFAVPINSIREILPGLREGKVVRGAIGVLISRQPLTEAMAKDMGLPRAGGVLVSEVNDGAARKAGMQVQDVITEYNGEPVNDSNGLVARVMRTAPGTTVPVRIYRNGRPMTLQVTVEELDLEAEQGLGRQRNRPEQRDPREPIETGFDMEIQEITPNIARQLNLPEGQGGAVITNTAPRGQADRGGLLRGDVILSINGRDMSGVDDVGDALDAVDSGRTARIVVWRQGRQILLLVTKR